MQGITRLLSMLFVAKLLYNLYKQERALNPVLDRSLLLIAHPDDESLFFGSFLYYNKPFIMCLSDGNLWGKGETRRAELKNLCNDLGVEYTIKNYQDNNRWCTNRILIDLVLACLHKNIKNIVTFDMHGISGHQNHVSCCKAAKLLQKLDKKGFFMYHYGKTLNTFEKFVLLVQTPTYAIPIHSMFATNCFLFHESQVVWFRNIYLALSNYMRYLVFE